MPNNTPEQDVLWSIIEHRALMAFHAANPGARLITWDHEKIAHQDARFVPVATSGRVAFTFSGLRIRCVFDYRTDDMDIVAPTKKYGVNVEITHQLEIVTD